MTPDQKAAHDWLMSQEDRIFCPLGHEGTTMTLKACVLRQSHLMGRHDYEDITGADPPRRLCETAQCEHYDPVNIKSPQHRWRGKRI